MPCQSRLAATIPHMAPPNGIPQVMRVTRPARLCGATASAARDSRFGRAPPSPRPAARRTASRASKGLTAAVAREKNPKITRQVTRVHFRPNRSAKRPKITAPTSSPTMLALNSGPSWSRVSPSAGAILGAARPIDTMSIPSQRMARKQSARVKRLRQPLSVARAPVMDCPPPAGILSRSAASSLIGGVQQSLDLVDRDRPLDDLRVRHLVCERPGDVVDLGAFDAGGLERMRHIEAGNEGSHLVG